MWSSRYLKVFVFLSLSIIAAAQKQDAFKKYYKKTLSGTPVKLDDKDFEELTAPPRNHTSAVLFTAEGAQFGCKLCQDFAPEWDVLAKSWFKGDPTLQGKLIFGTLDFADAKQVFQSMGIQTAPILFLYNPTTGPWAKVDSKPIKYDFSLGFQTADSILPFLHRNMPEEVPHPKISRPINWLRVGGMTTLVLTVITLGTVLYPYVIPFVQSRNLWAALSIIAILLFISGHMFNHIRGVPYVNANEKGEVSYFTGGFQSQLGLESQIVAGIYAVLAFATISLALKAPRMQDAKAQQVTVIVWGAVMYGMYSFLLSIFRYKNGGYPFFLPPF